MPSPTPHTSALRRLKIGLRWRAYTLMGWKIEGAFPNLHEPRLILLGPGLNRASGWTDFIEMRFRHQCLWWSLGMALPQNAHVLVATEEHNLGEVLQWASATSLQIHLVHRDDRHRRLRCNTAIEAGRHLRRLEDYVHRLFSYASG